MKVVLRRRPSASMVVAITALVVAASGTAVAASRVSGDKLIKKHSLSGNRLKNHTVTGKQIKLSSLGAVPNANALGGQPASSYLTTGNRIGTNGIVKVTGTSTGNTATLFSVGPFTVKMTCTTSGGSTSLTVNGTSSEGNSVLNGLLSSSTDLGATGSSSNPDVGASSTFSESANNNVDLEAPSGAAALLILADGVNWPSSGQCFANWSGIH